jgi:hypothetical protein
MILALSIALGVVGLYAFSANHMYRHKQARLLEIWCRAACVRKRMGQRFLDKQRGWLNDEAMRMMALDELLDLYVFVEQAAMPSALEMGQLATQVEAELPKRVAT